MSGKILITLGSTIACPTSILSKSTKTFPLLSPLRFFSVSTPLMADNQSIENLLVIGSGLMGAGVAQQAATGNKLKSVTLYDISDKQLSVARDKMIKNLQRIKSRKPDLDDEKIINSINFTTSLEVANAKNLLVVEAIPERIDLKQKLFQDLDSRFGQEKSNILATNTSSLSCKDIALHVTDTSRFGGLHFFNPVHLMKLVEVVKVEYPQDGHNKPRSGTSEATMNALIEFVKNIDRVSVVCRDTPGFIVNRLLLPYMRDAISMVERRDATVPDVDTAMKLGAGYPMGPFELTDYVGLDTTHMIYEAWRASGHKDVSLAPPKILENLVKRGHFGKKSGKGFYDYTTGEKKPPLNKDLYNF